MATDQQNTYNPIKVDSMSDNMILRLDKDGSVWGKVSMPQQFIQNQSTTGSVYINGIKYTTTSLTFVKLLPI